MVICPFALITYIQSERERKGREMGGERVVGGARDQTEEWPDDQIIDRQADE
jgi:hypothetical protein